MAQPDEEAARLHRLPHAQEGVDSDAGVAGPGIAVVPVAAVPDRLRERGGGGGDGRAGRGVGQKAERQEAADDVVVERSGVGDVGAPLPPSLLVALELRPGVISAHRDQGGAVSHAHGQG